MANVKSRVLLSSSPKTKTLPDLNSTQKIHRSIINLQQEASPRNSMDTLEELVQCGICLEQLSTPKMLPCQHTFCLYCLQSHLLANKLAKNANAPTVDEIKTATTDQQLQIKCPVCQQQVRLEKGFDSLEALPKNLYIDTLLRLVAGKPPASPTTKNHESYVCSRCRTSNCEQCCQHCMQVFCNSCWNLHLSELETNLTALVSQVEKAKVRLDHKVEEFQTRCQHITESIEEVAREKIEQLKTLESNALQEVSSIVNENQVAYSTINTRIAELLGNLKHTGNSRGKVTAFMAFHRDTSRIITQVSHFGEARLVFDGETFKIDQDTEEIYNEIEEEVQNTTKELNGLDNVDAMVQLYKTRSFTPKLVWNKCPRPAHVGIPPWDDRLLYITATDTHTVLILNRTTNKLEGRLAAADMMYPQGIAFSGVYQEIYVSDKWAHCIHVFSIDGTHSRTMLSKGSGEGRLRSPNGLAITSNNTLIVSDTGNDRILILNPKTGQQLSTIGVVGNKTMLNMPTGIAVSGDTIIVADTGDHRVKIFDMNGKKLAQFGSLGRDRGQFRSAEVVAVAPLGFILVGDGGNARVQVFKPDGSLVKIFGGKHSGLGWVSGLAVTSQLDIIVTDSKTRSMRIF